MAKLNASEGMRELEQLVKAERLIVMAGSGLSMPAPSNLPSWDIFLQEFTKECLSIADLLLTNYAVAPKLRPLLEEFKPIVHEGIADKKSPLRVASVLTNKLREIQRLTGIQVHDELDTWFRTRFGNAQPNDNHKIVVNTNYPIILTTNYDLLFEEAAKLEGYPKFRGRSYNFTDEEAMSSAIFHQEPCIIHLHGKCNKTELEQIVITAEDYRHIEKRHKLNRILEAIFLGYSTLFVGYGGTDDHLESLIGEMGSFFKGAMGATTYLLLPAAEATGITVEYRKSHGMEIIAVPDYAAVTDFLRSLKAIGPRAK